MKASHPHPVKHGASWRTKSQIQALGRTAPILPMQPGLPERRAHDYLRHGTTTRFAAVETATGKVTAACQPRHRHQEFLRFLNQAATAYPDVELHLVMDTYAAHQRVEVRRWLEANRRVHVHFTPNLSVLDEPGRSPAAWRAGRPAAMSSEVKVCTHR